MAWLRAAWDLWWEESAPATPCVAVFVPWHIPVSPVTGEEYYMQINFCLGRCTCCISWHLIQRAGPRPRVGTRPPDPALSWILWNTLSPEQSQHTHTGATFSTRLQSSCGCTDTIKPSHGKWIPAWCPRCLIWCSAHILTAVLSQVTSYFILKQLFMFMALNSLVESYNLNHRQHMGFSVFTIPVQL